jgi:hypothetical protein
MAQPHETPAQHDLVTEVLYCVFLIGVVTAVVMFINIVSQPSAQSERASPARISAAEEALLTKVNPTTKYTPAYYAAHPAEYWGLLVIDVLCCLPVAIVILVYLRGVIEHWFRPEQARLLYFLIFVFAAIIIDVSLRGPAAHERVAAPGSSPSEQALQELLKDQPTPLN